MRGIIFIFLFLTQQAHSQCLPPERIRALVDGLKEYMVKIDVQGSGDDGSGFLIKGHLGTELVTAHHVVSDDGGQKPSACEESDQPPTDPRKLLPASAILEQPQPYTRIPATFTAAPQHFSFEHDLVKLPIPGSGIRGLEPEFRPLSKGEGVIIAGFPAVKGRRLIYHLCDGKGYAEALNTTQNSAYEVNCPGLNYDIAAMSGGVAISACTGRVIGAVSYQNFHKDCPNSGDPRSVVIAPLNRNSAGQVAFGPPKVPSLRTMAWGIR